jgi:putative ABC transport system permease protein
MDREVAYWAAATPIGYVFTFGAIMGLVVGAIVVYQILFAGITDHLAEYATMKAMGYTNGYLARVVLMQAVILAVAGFVPGVAIAEWLYSVTRSATRMPMVLTPPGAASILLATVVLCAVSGLIAMRKLRAADPAEVF